MTKRRRSPRIFPGWWLVVTGSFLNLWGAGYRLYGFSALFKPISSELGFSRAVTSVASSISRFGGGIEAPIVGWLTDKIGPKWVAIFGVSIFTLGLILMNYVNSLWAFYLIWGIMVGAGMNAASGIPIATAIANWFVKKRGLATGLRMVLSGVLMLPLITWLITTQGWRVACVFGGIGMAAIGLPLVWFSMKAHRPEYYGLLPDGASTEEKTDDTSQMIDKGIKYAAEVQEIEFTLRQTVKTRAYWLLNVTQAIHNVASASLMLHFIPFITDMGVSAVKAAATVTIAGSIAMGSRVIGGLIADRVPKNHMRLVIGGISLLWAGGIGIFLLNQTIAMIFPFMVLHFLSRGVGMILLPLTGARYFGRKAYGSIRGSSVLVTLPLGFLGPVYLGWVFDTTGSYTIGFTAFAALLVFSAALMFLAQPPKPPAEVSDISKIL